MPLVRRKKKQKPRTTAAVFEKYLGKEPVFLEGTELGDADLFKILNWYNSSVDGKNGKFWLYEQMVDLRYSKEDIAKIKRVSDQWISSTACWLARLRNRGAILPARSVVFMKDKIDWMLSHATEPETGTKKSPMSRVETKSNEIICHLETVLDDFYMADYTSEFSIYDYLTHTSANNINARRVAEFYRPLLDEVIKAGEGYEHLSKKQLESYRNFMKMLVDDSTRFANNKNLRRVSKPRAAKVKTADQILKKFSYKKEDHALKIVSIDPKRILKAQTLWIYNDKYRKLGVYRAADAGGLSINGTKIINFDPVKSVSKGLRKPDDVLTSFQAAGKIALRTFMDDIKTKPAQMNGRISDEIILLRVE